MILASKQILEAYKNVIFLIKHFGWTESTMEWF